jgi:localization factor PodJL
LASGAGSTATPATAAQARSGSRKRLIYAGLVLLMAASFLAYKNYVKPRLQGSEPPAIELPVTPPADGKTGFLGVPADRIVTGSLPQDKAASSSAEMPPPSLGSDSLRAAAAHGNPNAQFIIAGRYLEGQGVGQDMAKAAYWYGLAAAQGLAPAQYRLATLYELGRGVPKDLKTAGSWYERAAMRGNVKAMHNAAVLAAGPEAGPADLSRAFRWFKAAAEQGFSDSQFNTAILYERGLGTKANPAEAYFWYSLAAKQGEADARVRASALGKSLSADQLTALGTLLRAWKPKPVDEGANTVTVTEQDWDVPDTGQSVKQSSLTSSWRAPRV